MMKPVVRTLVAILGVGAIGAWASGFPKRIGLSASEAAISLPGDLLIPGAGVVVDRAIRIDAPIEVVWRVLSAAFEDEERVVAKDEESALILRVPAPGLNEDEDGSGSCVFALLELGQGRTLLHMRERHPSREDISDAFMYALLGFESVSTMRMLRQIRDTVLSCSRSV